MTEFQVLDPVLVRLSASAAAAAGADGEENNNNQKLEGVVAVIDTSANRIGVRLTGSSVGKGKVSDKMGDLQCPPNGGIYVDIPEASTKPSERAIRKRHLTRLDELRLRRELGITAAAAASGTSSSSIRGASGAVIINRSRIRRRQDADEVAPGGGESSSQREEEASSSTSTSTSAAARTIGNPTAAAAAAADPPESFRLPPPTETSYSSNNDRNNKSAEGGGESSDDAKPEATNPLNETLSLEELQKEIAELPQQVKSTQERLEQIKQQKEQRFQQQQHPQREQQQKNKEEEPTPTQRQEQKEHEATTSQPPEPPEELPQEPAEVIERQQEPPETEEEKKEQDEPPVVQTPIRRSDPPGRSSASVALQRLRAWSETNETTTTTTTTNAEPQAEPVEAEQIEEEHIEANDSGVSDSAETGETEANSEDTSGEDFMIGQSSVAQAPSSSVEAITDFSSSLPMSPLEKVEAKNNPDLASRMDVSNCSSIGQEVSEVSFFLQSNAEALHQGLNGSNNIDKPFPNLSTQMEASQSSAERSSEDEKSNNPNSNNTTQLSSEGMEQVLDPWDRILLQSKGIMELDKPEVVLQAAAPQPVASIVDPWAASANTSVQSTSGILDVSNPYGIGANTSVQSTSVLDVSNPYGAMAPVPVPIPVPATPDRSSILQESSSKQDTAAASNQPVAASTPLRSNTRANMKTTGKSSRGSSTVVETKTQAPQEIGESSENSMGEVMKYILASQQDKNEKEEALQKSTTSSNSLDKKAINNLYAKAEEALQKSTTSFNSLDKKAPNNLYAKAASKSLPIHTTESTFSSLKSNQEETVGENSQNMGVMMRYFLEPPPQTPSPPPPPRKEEQEDFQKSATSFTSMDNKSANRRYAKAASAASPAHSTETTFADLLRKAEKRNSRKTPSPSIQSKPSFDESTMVSVGLESTTNTVQFDEKKEEDSHASSSKDSSKETPFSELKPLSINSKRQSFGVSKPWSKVLNRLTDDVPEPDFRRAKSAPAVSPTRAAVNSKSEQGRASTGMTSIGTFSENLASKEGSPDRSFDSYSTSSLPKPPGLRSQFDEDPDLFPLDEGGVSLGTSPIKGLEFNALMPLMTAFNDNSLKPAIGSAFNDSSMKPTIGHFASVPVPDFDDRSLMDTSVNSNAAVRTPKRSPTIKLPASLFGSSSVANGAYVTPPRPKPLATPTTPLRDIQVSSDSKLETSSITNEVVTPTPPRRTNAFGSPIKSPMENSVFANGAVSTPTRLPNNTQKPSNSPQNVFRAKSGQENKPHQIDRSAAMLDSSDETRSLLNTTANSLYSHDNNAADEKDAESFSSYAWTAQASVSESKSGDNDVFLAGTFDVESQASTPSKIPRITLDDSFSLYSHIEEPQDSGKSPAFLELDMTGQIKEIMKNTRAKRDQTRNETSKIVAISPLKSPNEEYNSDKESFVSSSSGESESLKESAVDDEFTPEPEPAPAPKKRAGPNKQKMIRCLAIVVAMAIGATAAVMYGVGILDLEIGDSERAPPAGQGSGSSSPKGPELLSLADRLGIEEFDMVLAHIQASLDWMVQNDSEEFTNNLETWQLDERFALITLYMATTTSGGVDDSKGDWKAIRGFLAPDISVCRWNLNNHGVFCDDQGRVIELYLDENEMSGVLPKELGRLSMMETISLASNRITGSIPASLFELPHLYSLVLSDNQLTGDIPESRNEELQILNLSGNYKLTGQIPESLTKQKSLKHLALLGTNIIGTMPEFAADSDLEFVAIADSRIGGTIPSSLTTLPNLRFLYLLENALSGTVPTEYSSENIFNSGNVLQHLYLSGNELNGSIPPELKELTRLQHVGLDFNDLTGVLPTELGSLDSLKYLYLNSNVNLNADLGDFELAPLLGRLKELQIQNTATVMTEDTLCFSNDNSVAYEWDFVSSDCEPPSNRAVCSCCNVCCPNNGATVDSGNVCVSFQPSGKSILENTVW